MAAITWDNVLDYAAELSTVDADQQTDILAYVNDEALDPDMFGDEEGYTFKMVRIFLAAHMATVLKNGTAGSGAAGPVIGESAGGLSRQYANLATLGADALLDTTTYGREYRRMVRRSLCRVPYVI